MKHTSAFAIVLAIAAPLAACGTSDANPEEPAAKPSSMKIGSAKRQCVMQASLGLDMPDTAIKNICGCAIDTLVENGSFTESRQPSEQDAENVLDGCISKFLESDEASQLVEGGNQP